MHLLSSTCLIIFLKCTSEVSAFLIGTNQTYSGDSGVCDSRTRGKFVLVKDRNEEDKVLICVQEKQGFWWKMMDAGNSYGNYFDPANDCSDILDNVPEAENGVFWIQTEKGPRKVWCDFETDGGGFMLIGVQNSSVTLDVPSDPSLVRPDDSRHWSSAFGDKKILDFRVQIATSKNFSDTKAHWYYRFNSPRKISELLLFGKLGCSKHHPGIGDVKFVKDIRDYQIATKQFNCSRFSGDIQKDVGWGKMNDCFKQDCKKGFAPIDLGRVAHSGSFSFSVQSSKSGLSDNSTAFIGCQNYQCCACFGPSSDKDYCHAASCKAINGGTVLKDKDQIHVWFWVRTSPTKRLWKKCMEYKKKNLDGNLEKWHVDEETGVPIKGPCSYPDDVKLTDGVAVVSNNESFTNLPKVPGLLSYRSDDKQLYLRGNSSWKSLAMNEEVQLELAKIRKNQETLIKEMKEVRGSLRFHLSCQSALKERGTTSSKNGVYRIWMDTSKLFSEVYCRMTSLPGCPGGGWTLVMKIDGRKETFHYDSSYWSNKKEYNQLGGLLGLDDVETKQPTYWSTSFTQLCVGMKVGSNLRFVSIPCSASSLYDLIADGNYRSTNLGRNKWKSLINNPSLQVNCNREGFNAKGTWIDHAKTRIGIVGNYENDCVSPDSYIGFGAPKGQRRHGYCGFNKIINTCGNVGSCASENGNKATPAMGYIFVR